MGLFQHKQHAPQSSDGDSADELDHFFDEYFREELRNRGRWYFEKVINENGELFKKDLESTVTQINTDLKDHVTKQLDEAITKINLDLKDHVAQELDKQFLEYTKAMKEAEESALASLTKSTKTLQEQHQKLSEALEHNVAEQQALLHNTFDQNNARMTAMVDAQDVAMHTLSSSVEAVQQQYQQLGDMLTKGVADQQAMLIGAFEQNMSHVIEHYLVGALGDQFDLKAQLPGIIQQMEANKQAMVDDMKL